MSSSSLRRSGRPSPARKQSRMIVSPADSRRAARRDEEYESDSSVCHVPASTKRKHPDPTTDDGTSDYSNSQQSRTNYSNSQQSRTRSQPKNKTKSRLKSQPRSDSSHQATPNDRSSQPVSLQINLAQDSEDENKKVTKKPKLGSQFDNIRDYYEDMIPTTNVSIFFQPLILHVLINSLFFIPGQRSPMYSLSVQVVWRRSGQRTVFKYQFEDASRWIHPGRQVRKARLPQAI
ncbi:hypothetical protein DFH28DRAFT_887461 [Melampsora americana]|nr:hypothetical protein DFH28DRAFT_891765 [Melampsora americana]KAH9818703.1 hypothetical protein DFH28DRAFT_887461 [Melampsora americana]